MTRIDSWPAELGFSSGFVDASDGTRLRVVTGGKDDAPPVVLLHGAPQMAFEWRHVLRELAGEARLVAPDLRGYGASDLAKSGDYGLDRLARDVDELLDALGIERAILVTHDWGGVVGWRYAETRPSRVRALVAVNAPHLAAYVRELRRPSQIVRSWYVALFQVPGIERFVARRDAEMLVWMMRSSARGAFSDDDLALYRAALARPGRASAVLAYYRGVFPRRLTEIGERARAGRIDVPVTMIWGAHDLCLATTHPEAVRRFAPGMEVLYLPGVSHWVPEERPDAVVAAVRRALARRPENEPAIGGL